MYARIETLREEVAAIRPVYSNTGDNSEVITISGTVYWDRRSIKSMRRAFARSHALDLSAQSAAVGKILGRSGILPFYLDSSRIFIPFKMRKPLAANDYCYGYVRMDGIDRVESRGGIPVLVLCNGIEIEITSSLASARQNLDLGRRLHEALSPPPDEDELMLQAVRVILAWLKKR